MSAVCTVKDKKKALAKEKNVDIRMRLDGQLIRFYLDLVHRNKPKQLFANGRARQQSRLIWAQLDSRRTEARPRRQCGTVAIATELMGCQRKDLERVGGDEG